MKSTPIDLNWNDLHSLFSVVMCVDTSMSIIYASETLSKGLPQVRSGIGLSEVFETLRPKSLRTFDDGIKNLGSLCLFTSHDENFAIRGQFLHSTFHGEEVLCFCGAPWLFWINTNAPDTVLGLSDFSPQDVQLDQLFFMSTEGKMIEDLEQLNSDLQVAKRQLEEAQEAQSQFFAQMSHEIRTPLNGVVSALSLLDQIPMDSEQSRFVSLAQSSSRNLMEVINYVLGVSKLELSGEHEVVLFSWADLIRSTVDVVKARAVEKSLTINLELSADLPLACFGEPARLRQTLLNLLINAIKFTDEGEITIRALTLESGELTSELRLEVLDTGLGITKGRMPFIFDPFWSEAPERRGRREEGTGLGLDIVRRNVKRMGGNIQVESIPGLGANFWFDLRVNLPNEVEKSNWIRDSQLSACAKSAVLDIAGHVLLVDDNETNLILGGLILESFGLRVTTVDGGSAAVDAVRIGSFDLVLMDVSMPDIDGCEATRQIRTFIDKDILPILALTAHVDGAEEKACLDVGMNGYLTKPIVGEQLRAVLAEWLTNDGGNGFEDTVATDSSFKNTALVKESVILELIKQIGIDSVLVVVAKVQEESSQRWDQLEIALEQGESAAIQRHVHSLASIFRSVGLLSIGNSLGDVEDVLRAGDTPEAGWLDALVELRVKSLSALNMFLGTVPR